MLMGPDRGMLTCTEVIGGVLDDERSTVQADQEVAETLLDRVLTVLDPLRVDADARLPERAPLILQRHERPARVGHPGRELGQILENPLRTGIEQTRRLDRRQPRPVPDLHRQHAHPSPIVLPYSRTRHLAPRFARSGRPIAAAVPDHVSSPKPTTHHNPGQPPAPPAAAPATAASPAPSDSRPTSVRVVMHVTCTLAGQTWSGPRNGPTGTPPSQKPGIRGFFMKQLVTVAPDADGVRVITCAGEFDQDTLEPLRKAAGQAADDPAVRLIVLDVSGVTFADSSMLNEIIRLRRTGRPLVLAGPLSHQLDRLFELTQAHQLFTVTDGVEAARAH